MIFLIFAFVSCGSTWGLQLLEHEMNSIIFKTQNLSILVNALGLLVVPKGNSQKFLTDYNELLIPNAFFHKDKTSLYIENENNLVVKVKDGYLYYHPAYYSSLQKSYIRMVDPNTIAIVNFEMGFFDKNCNASNFKVTLNEGKLGEEFYVVQYNHGAVLMSLKTWDPLLICSNSKVFAVHMSEYVEQSGALNASFVLGPLEKLEIITNPASTIFLTLKGLQNEEYKVSTNSCKIYKKSFSCWVEVEDKHIIVETGKLKYNYLRGSKLLYSAEHFRNHQKIYYCSCFPEYGIIIYGKMKKWNRFIYTVPRYTKMEIKM